MKRKALVFCIVFMFVSNLMSVSAEKANDYELSLPEYAEYLDGYEILKYDEEMVEYYKGCSDWTNDHGHLVHIYKAKNTDEESLTNVLYFESDWNGVRTFKRGWIDGITYEGSAAPATEEELNELLKKNGLEHTNAAFRGRNVILNGKKSSDDELEFIHLLLNNYEGFSFETCGSLEPDLRFSELLGDQNKDGKLDVRDAAEIAKALAMERNDFHSNVDFNKDGNVNIRDAAAIAKELATR